MLAKRKKEYLVELLLSYNYLKGVVSSRDTRPPVFVSFFFSSFFVVDVQLFFIITV